MNLTGERREVELTEAAMDAGVPQGNLGHRHGHGGCTVAAADGDATRDACPVAAARAGPWPP